jgi:hypothetical protein
MSDAIRNGTAAGQRVRLRRFGAFMRTEAARPKPDTNRS